jgi:hypothetical protein
MRQEAKDPAWTDGDLVNQNKIVEFANYWCSERKDSKGEPKHLKVNSAKGIVAGLQDLFKMQKNLQVALCHDFIAMLTVLRIVS